MTCGRNKLAVTSPRRMPEGLLKASFHWGSAWKPFIKLPSYPRTKLKANTLVIKQLKRSSKPRTRNKSGMKRMKRLHTSRSRVEQPMSCSLVDQDLSTMTSEYCSSTLWSCLPLQVGRGAAELGLSSDGTIHARQELLIRVRDLIRFLEYRKLVNWSQLYLRRLNKVIVKVLNRKGSTFLKIQNSDYG